MSTNTPIRPNFRIAARILALFFILLAITSVILGIHDRDTSLIGVACVNVGIGCVLWRLARPPLNVRSAKSAGTEVPDP